ncbi:MAG: FKBP-type peptidyl-prolyl cis-trans isomerase [Bacteroidetes bacterium]|nr:FKBP-type peptidyl-prolyl cis-trans isomerase [Bacteroidota bacterium]
MKYLFTVVFSLLFILPATAQNTKPAAKPVAKPAAKPAPAPLLKNYNDTLSYVLGEVAAFNLINQGFGDVKVNMTVFLRGFNDINGKKTPLVDDVTANALLTNYMTQKQEEACRPNIEAGEKFLAENKKRQGVMTTASGLQYEILKLGEGPKPAVTDTFVCHYRGTLINGTEFDASYNRNQPLEMPLTRVIAGWTEGLQLMPVGSKFKLFIPHQLGYGTRDNGTIPAGSTLIFEMELLDVKKGN